MQQKKLTGSGFAPLQAINLTGDVDPAVTALGTNAATAYQIGSVHTNVTTAAASTGVILPLVTAGAVLGDVVDVHNGGASTLTVYPPVGGTINGAASVTITAGSWTIFQCWDASGAGLIWLSK